MMKRNEDKRKYREMQRNVENCREIQRNTEKYRNIEKYIGIHRYIKEKKRKEKREIEML